MVKQESKAQMPVGNVLVLPVACTLPRAIKLIEDRVREEGWNEFDVRDLRLILEPYWFFHYTAYEEGEVEKKKRVTKTLSGVMALHAGTQELSPEVAGLFKDRETKNVERFPSEWHVQMVKPVLIQADALQVALIKAAHALNVSKENVHVSSLQFAYFPHWQARVDVKGLEEPLELDVDAVTEKFWGEEIEIPERTQGVGELVGETLNDLQDPRAWAEYTAGVGKTAAEAIKGAAHHKTHRTSENRVPFWKDNQTLIILLVIIAFVLFIIGFVFPV
ncbi:MAG: hypothetical protein HY393_00680 [Candidatus Diapherotrites archaeon]|nr:hypothetical protein [Candidatus Diapherotrites archaeon]